MVWCGVIDAADAVAVSQTYHCEESVVSFVTLMDGEEEKEGTPSQSYLSMPARSTKKCSTRGHEAAMRGNSSGIKSHLVFPETPRH